MSSTVGYATLQIIPSARGFQGALSGETNSAAAGAGREGGKRFGGGLMDTLKGTLAPMAGILAAAGVGAWLSESLDSLQRIERINTQTEAAIKSMGGAAGVTAQQIEDMAGALENATATEAESIQMGANLLLTFGNIKNSTGENNDIFNQAVVAMTDMSRALDTTGEVVLDQSSAATMLGKALNDPIKGVTALQRVGVSFSEQQKDSIKAMTESGDLMGAQKAILSELTKQFGGSAEAFASTTTGRVELAKHAIGTLGETIMEGVLPTLGAFADKAAGLLNGLAEEWPAILDRVSTFFEPVTSGLKGIFDLLVGGDYTGTLARVFGVFEDDAVVANVLAIRQAVIDFFGSLTAPGGTGAQIFAGLREGAAAVAPILANLGGLVLTHILPPLLEFGGFVRSTIVPALQEFGAFVAAKILPALSALGGFIVGTLIPAAVSMGGTLLSTVVPILQTLWQNVETKILPAFQKIVAVVTEKVLPVLLKIGAFLAPIVQWLFKVGAAVVGFVAPILLNLAGSVLGGLINALGNVIGWIGDFVGWVISAIEKTIPYIKTGWAAFQVFKDRIVTAFQILRAAALAIFEKVRSFITQKIAQVVQVASSIIAFKDRVVAAFTGLRDQAIQRIVALVSEVRAVPGKALSAVGNLASTLVSKGRDLIQGFIEGIRAKASSIVSAIKDTITDKLPGFVKDALGIRSPSRVFMALGRYTAEGMAEGIRSGAADVQRAADGLVPNAPAFASPDVAFGGVTGAVERGLSAVTIRVDDKRLEGVFTATIEKADTRSARALTYGRR